MMGLSEARAHSVEEPPPALAFASAADFAGFYDEWHSFVWRTARRLGARDAVDDIVQEVFLTIHGQHGSFEGRGTLRAWVAGIVLNTARRHFRTQSRRREESVDAADDILIDTHTPHASAEQREMLALLYALLESMPAERREVFVMSELEKLSAPEIAAATKTNLNTVYARVRAARTDFAERLHRHRAKVRAGGEST